MNEDPNLGGKTNEDPDPGGKMNEDPDPRGKINADPFRSGSTGLTRILKNECGFFVCSVVQLFYYINW